MKMNLDALKALELKLAEYGKENGTIAEHTSQHANCYSGCTTSCSGSCMQYCDGSCYKSCSGGKGSW